jgi:hypothetical protein
MDDKRKERLRRQKELERRKKVKTQRVEPADILVGYVCRFGNVVVCDGDACVVAGTYEAMVAILKHNGYSLEDHIIEPAQSLHILKAMQLGGAYAMDEQAYNRFLPEAQKAGLPLVEEDFSDPGPIGIHLVRIGFQ